MDGPVTEDTDKPDYFALGALTERVETSSDEDEADDLSEDDASHLLDVDHHFIDTTDAGVGPRNREQRKSVLYKQFEEKFGRPPDREEYNSILEGSLVCNEEEERHVSAAKEARKRQEEEAREAQHLQLTLSQAEARMQALLLQKDEAVEEVKLEELRRDQMRATSEDTLDADTLDAAGPIGRARLALTELEAELEKARKRTKTLQHAENTNAYLIAAKTKKEELAAMKRKREKAEKEHAQVVKYEAEVERNNMEEELQQLENKLQIVTITADARVTFRANVKTKKALAAHEETIAAQETRIKELQQQVIVANNHAVVESKDTEEHEAAGSGMSTTTKQTLSIITDGNNAPESILSPERKLQQQWTRRKEEAKNERAKLEAERRANEARVAQALAQAEAERLALKHEQQRQQEERDRLQNEREELERKERELLKREEVLTEIAHNAQAAPPSSDAAEGSNGELVRALEETQVLRREIEALEPDRKVLSTAVEETHAELQSRTAAANAIEDEPERAPPTSLKSSAGETATAPKTTVAPQTPAERFEAVLAQRESIEGPLTQLADTHAQDLKQLERARNAAERSGRRLRQKKFYASQRDHWEDVVKGEVAPASRRKRRASPHSAPRHSFKPRPRSAGSTRMQSRLRKPNTSSMADTVALIENNSDVSDAVQAEVLPAPATRKGHGKRPKSAPSRTKPPRRPGLPARLVLPERPMTTEQTYLRHKHKAFDYTKSVLVTTASRWDQTLRSDTSFDLNQIGKMTKLQKKKLQRSRSMERRWVDPISSPPKQRANARLLIYSTGERAVIVPRRPSSAAPGGRRRPGDDSASPRARRLIDGDGKRPTEIDWLRFETKRISAPVSPRPSALAERGGRARDEPRIEVIFPNHPQIEMARTNLMNAVSRFGSVRHVQVSSFAEKLCQEYNNIVIRYLAGKLAGTSDDHAVLAKSTESTDDRIANEMLSRALNLTEPKMFFAKTEQLRCKLRSAALNNMACLHSSCNRPKLALKALWEARVLSWNGQKYALSSKRQKEMSTSEVRTVLNMSSLYNKQGEYEKALKLLTNACISLRKRTILYAKGNETSKADGESQSNELLPLTLYSLGCTHEHLCQWKDACQCFSEASGHAKRLFGPQHLMVQQCKEAHEDAMVRNEVQMRERKKRNARMARSHRNRTNGFQF